MDCNPHRAHPSSFLITFLTHPIAYDVHDRTVDGHVTCQASESLHDCLAICQASTVDFIIRRCQGSRNIYHGFLWKSGVAASLPAGMEFVPEFHIHCYSCVPTHHGWCARLCSRLYRPADDRASVFYSPPELSYRIVSIRMYPYTRHLSINVFQQSPQIA